MGRQATGIDVGTSTAKLLRGEAKGNRFVVTDFAVAPNEDGGLASGYAALAPGSKPSNCRIGVTGREVNIRYTRVPRVPDWQLRKLMRFETEEISGNSENEIASDFNLLPEIPEIDGEDVVLLAMARESLLEEHLDGLDGLGGKLDAFTPNAIALYNAFLHYGVVMDDTVLVANIGAENTDVILVRGTDLVFARNLSGGSRLFDDAISERFNIQAYRAERYKIEATSLSPNARFEDANAEKASRAMLAPAGQLLSLLESTVMFCKSQVKLSSLKVDRVLLCGGGAALDGLPEYVSKGMGVPCELFDPFVVVDTDRLSPEAADALEEHRLEAVIALGLAHAGSDDGAYSIEILPESVAKKRAFMTGPLWLIAAAVVAVAFLGLYGFKQNERLVEVSATESAKGRKAKSASGVSSDTEELVIENEGLATYVNELYNLAGSGEQILRTMGVVERHLPPGFWLESMTSDWGSDEELRVDRVEGERPILHLKGRTREGTDSPQLRFEEFVAALKHELDGVTLKERMGTSGAQFTIDLTMLAPDLVVDEDGVEEFDEGDE